MNIASAGKVLSFEGGFSTLSKAKLNLNVAAESVHDGEETLLLAIILGEGFYIIHIEEMIQLAELGHIPIRLLLSIKLRKARAIQKSRGDKESP